MVYIMKHLYLTYKMNKKMKWKTYLSSNVWYLFKIKDYAIKKIWNTNKMFNNL